MGLSSLKKYANIIIKVVYITCAQYYTFSEAQIIDEQIEIVSFFWLENLVIHPTSPFWTFIKRVGNNCD